jgi:hypothetical protein
VIIVDYGMFELVYDWIWNWLLVYDYEHAEIEIDDYYWIELVSLWILNCCCWFSVMIICDDFDLN